MSDLISTVADAAALIADGVDLLESVDAVARFEHDAALIEVTTYDGAHIRITVELLAADTPPVGGDEEAQRIARAAGWQVAYDDDQDVSAAIAPEGAEVAFGDWQMLDDAPRGCVYEWRYKGTAEVQPGLWVNSHLGEGGVTECRIATLTPARTSEADSDARTSGVPTATRGITLDDLSGGVREDAERAIVMGANLMRYTSNGDVEYLRDGVVITVVDTDARTSRTDAEIVEEAEQLARRMAEEVMGYNLDAVTIPLRDMPDPRVKMCWQMACLAIEQLQATDVTNALAGIGE
jgi:hypothetical protein